MKKAFLRNGEEVILHEEFGNGNYIIERLYTYSYEDGDSDVEPCGVKEVVNEVFLVAPIEKKEDELAKILDRIELKNKELRDIETQLIQSKRELSVIEKQKTDIKKHIIDRSELLKAKTLTVFDGFRPVTLTEDNRSRSFGLSYRLDLIDGRFNGWICNIDYEGRRVLENSINLTHGILIDATDEEILEKGKQIVRDAKSISDYDLMNKNRIPDEFLTEELMARRIELLKTDRENRIKRQQAVVLKEQSILDELLAN